jgi:hypothetical protein
MPRKIRLWEQWRLRSLASLDAKMSAGKLATNQAYEERREETLALIPIRRRRKEWKDMRKKRKGSNRRDERVYIA